MTDRAHPGVHMPLSFACGPGGCIATYIHRPPRQIASALLEDVTDWHNALRGVDEIPPGVVAAIRQAHEAVATWCELIERKEGRADG